MGFSTSTPPKFEHKLHHYYNDVEKLPPQLYLIKRKICYDQGYKDIGVVIAMKRLPYLFYLRLKLL